MALGGGLVVLVERGDDGFQVFCFKDLIAIQASDVVHTVAPRHDFSAGVIAGLHSENRDYPHSKRAVRLVKPLKVLIWPEICNESKSTHRVASRDPLASAVLGR